MHSLTGIECEQIHQAALSIFERRIGMSVCLEVIGITIPIEVERKFCRLLGSYTAHVADILWRIPFRFSLAGGAGISQTFLHTVYLRIEETVAANESRVEHAECGDSLEPFVGLRSRQRVASAATNAENADTACIYTRILCKDVGSAMYVLYSIGGLVRIARLTLCWLR